MYKCKECGQEYKTKPDYCDCGNDTFEEIQSIKSPSVIEKYDISIFAILFFITCLILSALVLLFFANPKPQTEQTQTQIEEHKKIPNIDSFWDNTPIKPVQEEIEPIEEQKPIIQNIQNLFKPEPKKTVQVQTPAPKPIQKPIQAKPTVVEKQTTAPKPVVKQTSTTIKSTSTTQTVNDREVYNYKIRLRNSLFGRLNYANLQGSGKCGIQFSVNSEGKLINRAFTFQSDNKTINDEIYRMMMRMPVFDAPPNSYHGEIIKLTFEYNEGSYEINLVN